MGGVQPSHLCEKIAKNTEKLHTPLALDTTFSHPTQIRCLNAGTGTGIVPGNLTRRSLGFIAAGLCLLSESRLKATTEHAYQTRTMKPVAFVGEGNII